MYVVFIILLLAVSFAAAGLFGAWPGLIIGFLLAVGAILWFSIKGRDAKDSPQVVTPPLEPSGEVRQPAPRSGSGSAETANERVGQA